LSAFLIINHLLLQPIVAVPAFMCAGAFSKFLPFCTGFAAGCMIWMVVSEVLPDAFKVIC
jgi:zinc transporter ZupT